MSIVKIVTMKHVKNIYVFDALIDNALRIRGMTMAKNSEGAIFVNTPKEKADDGKYYDRGVGFAYTKDKTRTKEADSLCDEILSAAKQYLKENKEKIDEAKAKKNEEAQSNKGKRLNDDDVPF